MRERPPLSDGALAATLADGWGVAAASVEFLPVGNDSRAWSFGVVAADGSRRFCKLRRGPVGPGAVRVPMVLREQGLEEVVAAVPHGGRRAVAAAGRLHPAAVPVGGGQAGDGAGVERPAVDRPRPVRGRAAPDRAAGGAGGDGDPGVVRPLGDRARAGARRPHRRGPARRAAAPRAGRAVAGPPHRDRRGGRPGPTARPGRGRRPPRPGPVPRRPPYRQPPGRRRRPAGRGRLGRAAAGAEGTGPHVRHRRGADAVPRGVRAGHPGPDGSGLLPLGVGGAGARRLRHPRARRPAGRADQAPGGGRVRQAVRPRRRWSRRPGRPTGG